MAIKHPTASLFPFHLGVEGWRLGLIRHPRLGLWMVPGGHVEADESTVEAALRETTEETGLVVRLVHAPSPPLPARFPQRSVPLPWWVLDLPVPADSHAAAAHVHLDHVYVGLASSADPGSVAAHDFGWFGEGQLAGLDMVEDTRRLAAELFACIDIVVGGEAPVPADLAALWEPFVGQGRVG